MNPYLLPIPIGHLFALTAGNTEPKTKPIHEEDNKMTAITKKYPTRKYCSAKSDIPKGPHYAILEFDSIYIPGDERSRTCPGHGYPESTANIIRYIAFTDKSEWEADILERMNAKYCRKEFIPIKVDHPIINVVTTISSD